MENTHDRQARQQHNKDHLHLRGEYLCLYHLKEHVIGSSPLTWRIHLLAVSKVHLQRIISTYVENTNWVWGIFKREWGSSPLTWRIRLSRSSAWRLNGIISTYVENTPSVLMNSWEFGDHLHLRGEYQDMAQLIQLQQGSSPLTWRIPSLSVKLKSSDRIISTYVENTHAPCVRALGERDHLHLRGEYKRGQRGWQKEKGSSPLTWRILLLSKIKLIKWRIISTYVENTTYLTSYMQKEEDHLHLRGEYQAASDPAFVVLGSSPLTWRIH